jgi:hypothetical protein
LGDTTWAGHSGAHAAILSSSRSKAMLDECSISSSVLRLQHYRNLGWPHILQASIAAFSLARRSGMRLTWCFILSHTNILKIALGTAILLSGVFALSWRLHDESDAPSQAASALTPGIGYMDTDSEDSGGPSEYYDDLNMPKQPLRGEEEDNKLLAATVQQRRRLSQAEEIWGELQDDDTGTPLASSFPEDIAEDETEADESTSLLRKHSNKRRPSKRNSYGFPGASSAASTPRSLTARRQQGPVGGWWKTKWWRNPSARDRTDLA